MKKRQHSERVVALTQANRFTAALPYSRETMAADPDGLWARLWFFGAEPVPNPAGEVGLVERPGEAARELRRQQLREAAR
jgi:hypothetical protein